MELDIISSLENDGTEIPINAKGWETVEVDLTNISAFSIKNKALRMIGFDKPGLFRLSLKSYKALKKELFRRGQDWRYM